jgi:hypothetical protein
MTKYQRQKPLTTLAMTIQDHIITAEEARLTAECACFCLHCRCPLLLYSREPYLPAYFRHDPCSLTAEHLELCAEADLPEIQENPCTPVVWWFNTLETGAVPFAIRDCIASWRQKSLRKNHLMPLQPDLTGKRQLLFTSVPIV